MYSMRLLVGAESGASFAQALEEALDKLGRRVLSRSEHASLEEAHAAGSLASGRTALGAQGSAPPSILFQSWRDLEDAPPSTLVEVSGVRAALWNLSFARKLSEALGSLAVVYINDRLHCQYGNGLFFAGHIIETAVTDAWNLSRYGGEPTQEERSIRDQCHEDENYRRFGQLLCGLAREGAMDPLDAPQFSVHRGAAISRWSLSEGTEKGDLDTEVDPILCAVLCGDELESSARRHLSAFGWSGHAELALPLYDPCALDPATFAPLEREAHGYYACLGHDGADPSAVLDCARAGRAAVIVRLPARASDPIHYWSRSVDSEVQSGEVRGTTGFLRTWRPVCRSLETTPLQFRFPNWREARRDSA